MWAAEPGPAVVVHRFSCSAACGGLPRSGIEPMSLALGRRILSYLTTREVPGLGFKDQISIVVDNGVGISDEGGKK